MADVWGDSPDFIPGSNYVYQGVANALTPDQRAMSGIPPVAATPPTLWDKIVSMTSGLGGTQDPNKKPPSLQDSLASAARTLGQQQQNPLAQAIARPGDIHRGNVANFLPQASQNVMLPSPYQTQGVMGPQYGLLQQPGLTGAAQLYNNYPGLLNG